MSIAGQANSEVERRRVSSSRAGWLLAAFSIAALFYWFTRAANHAVATDAWLYAYAAEENPIWRFFDTRMMLFHMLNRAVWLASDRAGLGLDGFTAINLVTVAGAAGGVVMAYRLLRTAFAVDIWPAVLGAACLGFSFGYWHYAGVAEVYTPSCFIALALSCAILPRLKAGASLSAWVGWGALSGLAALFYQPLVFPLFFAMGIAFLAARRVVAFIVYGAAGVAVVAAGYALAYASDYASLPGPFELAEFAANRFGEFSVAEPYTLRKLLWAPLAIAHDTVSTYWLFAFDRINSAWSHVQPDRDIGAERFAAVAGRPLDYAAIVLVPALLAAGLALAARNVSARPLREGGVAGIYLAAWAAIILVVHTIIDPRSMEAWIMLLPPLSLLFALLVVAPAWRRGDRALAVATLALLALANFTGGIVPMRAEGGDLNKARLEGLAGLIRPGDTVLQDTYDDNFESWLHYATRAGVAHPDRAGMMNTRDGAFRVKRGFAEVAAGSRVLIFAHNLGSAPLLAEAVRAGAAPADAPSLAAAWAGCAVELGKNRVTALLDVTACVNP